MRKKVQKQERFEFRMDADLKAKVMLKLYSPLQECVPYGALAHYVVSLIKKDLLEQDHAQKPQAGLDV